jgi:two-component system, response regulator PdtaR
MSLPISQVLLVEDDSQLRSFMSDLLTDHGLAVTCASNGSEAMTALERGPLPSILVTDINLGGEASGLDLALVVAERWPQVRLLIISGEVRPAHDQYPERAMFFTKPFAIGALISMIRSSDW